MPTIRDIANALEAWAPPATAQSYDNVGLQVGDPSRPVQKALIGLDMTPALLEEARKQGATLIITHHPLLFSPLRHLTPHTFVSNLAFRLAEAGIALYSIHTNLDVAPAGVSFALAEQLGLTDVGFLDDFSDSLYKLVTFVPKTHAEAVRMALAEAGTGRIGNYEACAFESGGRGYFRPLDTANPFIGKAGGKVEQVEEVRIEVEVPRWHLNKAVVAMKAAHPYEEVAYDVYPVEQAFSGAGLGAMGHLKTPESLADFLKRVANQLDTPALRYVGDLKKQVETVAVCGGSGSSLIPKAIQAGADAFVTADVTYHKFFDVLDTDGRPAMALIDAGHYETEAITEQLLVNWLSKRFPKVKWRRTSTRTGPMKTFVR